MRFHEKMVTVGALLSLTGCSLRGRPSQPDIVPPPFSGHTQDLFRPTLGQHRKDVSQPAWNEVVKRIGAVQPIEVFLPGSDNTLIIIGPETHSDEEQSRQFETMSKIDRILKIGRMFLEGHVGTPMGLETEDTMRWSNYGLISNLEYYLLAEAQVLAVEQGIQVPLKSRRELTSLVLRLDRIESVARREFPDFPDFDLSRLSTRVDEKGEKLHVLDESTGAYILGEIFPQYQEWFFRYGLEERTAKWAAHVAAWRRGQKGRQVVYIACGAMHALPKSEFPRPGFSVLGEQLNKKAGFATVTLSELM